MSHEHINNVFHCVLKKRLCFSENIPKTLKCIIMFYLVLQYEWLLLILRCFANQPEIDMP